MVDLVFVPTQTRHGKGSDTDARKFVRVTAMRTFRRRQRQENIKQHLQRQKTLEQSQDNTPITNSDSDTSPPDLTLELASPSSSSLCRLEAVSNPWPHSSTVPRIDYSKIITEQGISGKPWSPNFSSLDLGTSQFDTLSSSSVLEHPSRSYLFKHFCNVIAPALLPLGINRARNPIITSWVRHALQEPAMLEAALFHSSAHVDGLLKRPWTRATLYHQGEAIRLTNELLRSPDRATSDACIAAIVMLWGTGNFTGDQTEAGLHIEAMKNMIELRGGLGNLGMDGSLEMLISIGDCIRSTILLSEPTFKQISEDEIPDPPLDFETGMQDIFKEISRLSKIMDVIFISPNISTEEILSFNRQRTAVEHRLLFLDIASIARTNDQTQINIYRACYLATLLSINYLFRDPSPVLSVLSSLESRLLKTLVKTEAALETHHMTSSNVEMLLWTCWIAGMISRNKEWFANGTGRMMGCLGLTGWEAVERCLKKFLWTERMRDRNCIALWHEVERQLGCSPGDEIQQMVIPRTQDMDASSLWLLTDFC